jgi:hypothetical protein
MKNITAITIALLTSATFFQAQEIPQMPPPAKEHAWLQKFVGNWEAEAEIIMDPAKPPMKSKGTETVRPIGGFWILSEGKSEAMGMKFDHVLTLGYDPEKKKYIGTWFDSMSSYLWKYEGTVDPTGKILTLETEGPCPKEPGKISKFKEVTEFKSDDRRVFTSSMLGDDGKWTTFVTVDSRRKK